MAAFLLSFGRVLKFSFQDILRNVWLSLVTIMIMILTLFSVNLLMAVKAISGAAVDTIKNKIDISLYLKPDAQPQAIAILKARLEGLSSVKQVEYVSQEDALAKFKQQNIKDVRINDALAQLSSNPLSPSLVVRPRSADEFELLLSDLNNIDDPLIQSRDYDNYKQMLQKIDGITRKVSEAGFLVSTIFILITLLVIYNTAKVAVYTHRNEIGIMRLVGASNWFVKAPFVVSSVVYTLISLLFVVFTFFLFLGLLQPYLETFFAGYSFNIVAYFADNFLAIFGFQFLVAGAVNVLASWLAVSKYSHV
ncbi:MAG: permease-like cell division protein FtsX [Candidatus Falkowbacteria bacterium]